MKLEDLIGKTITKVEGKAQWDYYKDRFEDDPDREKLFEGQYSGGITLFFTDGSKCSFEAMGYETEGIEIE